MSFGWEVEPQKGWNGRSLEQAEREGDGVREGWGWFGAGEDGKPWEGVNRG